MSDRGKDRKRAHGVTPVMTVFSSVCVVKGLSADVYDSHKAYTTRRLLKGQ